MELEALKKQVADLVGLVEKNQKEQQGNIENLVKAAIANHPGFTKQRTITLPNYMGNPKDMQVAEIIASMPEETRQTMDDCVLVSKILKRPVTGLKMWGKFSRMAGDFKKALDATNASEGGDWVPTDFSSQLLEKVHLQLKVAALFPVIQMPSNPYELPVEIADIDSFVLSEQTADTGQTKIPVGDTTGIADKTTLTAKWHATRVLTSKILEEDSIVAILPLLRNRMIAALARGREDVILNGDTAGTHEDSDTTSATSRRKAYLGLRAEANDNDYKVDISTFTTANLRQLKENMGVYGVDPSKLAWVVGVRGFFKMLSLSEVITIDKIGQSATILKGQMASFDGSPVIVSEQIRQDLNASAVYQAGQAKTVLHCVHTDGHVIGARSETYVQLLDQVYAESGQDALIVAERFAFRDSYPIATHETHQMGYNF